jgi:hypothetical protein
MEFIEDQSASGNENLGNGSKLREKAIYVHLEQRLSTMSKVQLQQAA